ncbi:uncharacterized protein LOC128585403 [Nycticebus coucang]|uniref:uncharacterized protein LOC128585403 n=1 Tax=Nycticebus coucang TaxID=9470 RepID=UPI00234C27E8|nr:uncharacterized protein LOC128585403 [Nycticebus coucang]
MAPRLPGHRDRGVPGAHTAAAERSSTTKHVAGEGRPRDEHPRRSGARGRLRAPAAIWEGLLGGDARVPWLRAKRQAPLHPHGPLSSAAGSEKTQPGKPPAPRAVPLEFASESPISGDTLLQATCLLRDRCCPAASEAQSFLQGGPAGAPRSPPCLRPRGASGSPRSQHPERRAAHRRRGHGQSDGGQARAGAAAPGTAPTHTDLFKSNSRNNSK